MLVRQRRQHRHGKEGRHGAVVFGKMAQAVVRYELAVGSKRTHAANYEWEDDILLFLFCNPAPHAIFTHHACCLPAFEERELLPQLAELLHRADASGLAGSPEAGPERVEVCQFFAR